MLFDGKEISVRGRLLRIARLKAEYYEWVADPRACCEELRRQGLKADVFTFLEGVARRQPRYPFYHEQDSIAVLTLTSYEHWWKNQINDKTRNMVRKAQKSGVAIRPVAFSDELVAGIKEIYDESPVRQGKPFSHYRKDIATLRSDLGTYVDRSDFLGAFHDGKLIGFVKLVHGDGISHLMQIISMMNHRDKAPTNGLMDAAVRACVGKHVPYLHYGIWSRHGLGDFKKHHDFQRFDLIRYFVPLTARGKLLLGLDLHRGLSERLPDPWVKILIDLRSRWNSIRVRGMFRRAAK